MPTLLNSGDTGPRPLQSIGHPNTRNESFYSFRGKSWQFHMILHNLYFILKSYLSGICCSQEMGLSLPHPVRVTYSRAGKDRVFCGFHDHLVGRASSALLGLVVPKLFTDARHRRLRTVLRVRGIRPIVCMTGGHGKADHTGGRLGGRGGQSVQPVGWRHLFKKSPYQKGYHPFTAGHTQTAKHCTAQWSLYPSPYGPASPTALCSPPPLCPSTAGAQDSASALTLWKRQAVAFLLIFKPRYSSWV